MIISKKASKNLKDCRNPIINLKVYIFSLIIPFNVVIDFVDYLFHLFEKIPKTILKLRKKNHENRKYLTKTNLKQKEKILHSLRKERKKL